MNDTTTKEQEDLARARDRYDSKWPKWLAIGAIAAIPAYLFIIKPLVHKFDGHEARDQKRANKEAHDTVVRNDKTQADFARSVANMNPSPIVLAGRQITESPRSESYITYLNTGYADNADLLLNSGSLLKFNKNRGVSLHVRFNVNTTRIDGFIHHDQSMEAGCADFNLTVDNAQGVGSIGRVYQRDTLCLDEYGQWVPPTNTP